MIAIVLFLLPWAGALFLVRRHHHLDGGTVAILVSASLGLPTLWLMWTTYRGPKRADTPVRGLSLDQVADQLAIAVGAQWNAEAAIRRLNDPYPLPVSWTAADASLTDPWDSLVRLATSGAGWPEPPGWGTWAAGPDDLAGEGGELVESLAQVPTGRLVVLGEPGAGKTMLMVRLVLDLLTRRAKGAPVPILVSVTLWDPVKQDLWEWLAAQLITDHPALASPFSADMTMSTQAMALLTSKLILPILDGLDEIPRSIRGRAIRRINDAIRPGMQVVVTCRTQQYRDAVHPIKDIEITLRGAAAIQLRPLDTSAVRDYLSDDAAGPTAKARWGPVFNLLGTETPIGQALTTPLMVSLARAMYNPRPGELVGTLRDPMELCGPALAARTAVESLLFDGFIPAAYRHDSSGRWEAADAEKWLVFLARHLERYVMSPDLAWWQLRYLGPCATFERAAGLVFLLMFNGFVFWLAAVPRTMPRYGLVSGFVIALALGLVTGFLFWRMQSGETPSRGMRISVGGLAGGLVGGLGFGLAGGLGFGLAGGLGFGLGGGLGGGLRPALAVGLANAPENLAIAAQPRAVLARDRRAALLLMLAFGIAAGLGFGLGFGLWFGLRFGVLLGLAGGFAFGLLMSDIETVWPSHMLTIGWLAFHHRLPWSLMSFLTDAHRRGVLRQAGAVYQFRHIELQHRLANRDTSAVTVEKK